MRPLWNLRGVPYSPAGPMVMGILNATPDSFHAESRRPTVEDALAYADRMLQDGATILDIGGASTRPGAEVVSEQEELHRALPLVEAIHRRFPEVPISIDTYRAVVAAAAVEVGASLVNDIGAGQLDPAMLPTVAALRVPYIAMHMQGTPSTMQQAPHYADVASEVVHFLDRAAHAAQAAGIADVIVDPGLGFGKTTAHNFTLLQQIPRLRALGFPVLIGLSRKRMINEVLGTTPAGALNGTTVLNTIALLQGADILRVHDVREAVQAVQLVRAYGLQGEGPSGDG